MGVHASNTVDLALEEKDSLSLRASDINDLSFPANRFYQSELMI